MKNQQDFAIAVLPGDGIGPEVMTPCLALLDEVVARVGAPAHQRSGPQSR